MKITQSRLPLTTWFVETIVAAGVMLLLVIDAWSEYRLDVGDILEISVAGVPDLKQRVPVLPDGSISYPLLGTLVVAGLSNTDARLKIQAGLAAKVFRQRGPDGHETAVIIEPDQVTAAIAEFRPVIVNGDVARPGQQSYRPFMTVREAVALSGGYDLMRFRFDRNPFLESADLRSEYDAQWTEFIKEQANIWRIRSELGREGALDQKRLLEAPIRRSTIAEIVGLESEQLDVRQADYQGEKTYLQSLITQTSEHIQVVSEELQKDEEGLRADAQDLQRLTDLFTKGAVPMPRVTDARRALLLASTRKLQTASQLMQLQKQKLDASRQLDRLDAQRKSDLLRELQERSVRVSEIRSKLQSIDEKLQHTGMVRSQLVRGGGAKPELVVIRRGEHGRARLDADEDFELEPGDVIEVTLRQPATEVSAK